MYFQEWRGAPQRQSHPQKTRTDGWQSKFIPLYTSTLQWRHTEHNGVPKHRRLDYLVNRLFRSRSTKTSKLRVTGLCEGNSPMTGEFPAQMASNAENVSIWRRHHEYNMTFTIESIIDPIWFEKAKHLTHCDRDNIGATLQTTFSNIFKNKIIWISTRLSLKFIP